MTKKLRNHSDHDSLKNAGREKCGRIAVVANQIRDNRYKKESTSAKAGGDHARSEPAARRKPFQGGANATAVDERSADARQSVKEIELWQCCGVPHGAPADTAKDSSGRDEPSGADSIDEPAIQGLHPGLQKYKECECAL